MSATIHCLDKYEAQKLSGLIYIKDSKETFVSEITGIYDNELVITLKDKSVHSILLQDARHAEMLADFLQSVVERRHAIAETVVAQHTVRITKR